MIKNYFKIAFRNFWRNKVFSSINVLGLSIGISAALVIYLIAQHEMSYEKFQKDGNQIFRVVSEIKFPDLTIHNSGVPGPTAKATKAEITGLENVTHFFTTYETKVLVPITSNQTPAVFKKQQNIIYADEEYFNLFNYQWLAGSASSALKDPHQVVLTESRAKTYFASLSPDQIIGREILYDDSIKTIVSGVVKDLEGVTDFTFKEFISRKTMEQTGLREQYSLDEWGGVNSNSQMFVKLAKNTAPQQIETQLVAIREKYRSKNKEDANHAKDDTHHYLQALNDIHFNADYDAFNQRQASKSTLVGLFTVAAFLLLLGCINFINLTTAQATQRAKEIGIRKTMGSGKLSIIFQFLCETFVLTFLATILSVAIIPWLLKIFSDFIPAGISFTSLNNFHVWVFLFVLLIVVSFVSGIYPSFVLTRFSPVTALKNQVNSGTTQTRKAWMRKTLTVTQFIIAQFLVIATLVVSKQVKYSLNKDLGYKKDAIVYFFTPWNFFSNTPDNRRFALYQKLKAIPEIEKVSLSGTSPASNNTSTTTLTFDDGKKKVETMVEMKYADTAYFDLYQLKLLAGKGLQQSDTTKEFVINETYAKILGFSKPEDALGHLVTGEFGIPITGVVADFNTKSTHEAIKPLAYSSASKRSYVLHITLKPQSGDGEVWKRALAKAEKAYKEFYPEDEFSYNFFDESIASFYKEERNIFRLLTWASGLCVFISCLGLLGLTIFITNTRTKEIGVRKVLGATVGQIVLLMSKDFLSLVIIAFVITLPLAWWVMHNWLQGFVYRTPLSWWVFAITGLGMFIIATVILSIQTIKSASVNPVKSLRTE